MKTANMGWLLAGMLLSGAAALAADGGGFKTSMSIGTTLARGNSDSFQVNGSVITEGEKVGLGSVRAGIEANYGESTVDEVKSTSIENERVFGNVKKTLSEFMFAYVDGSALKDEIAQVDYRFTIGPGFGVYVVKNSNTTLSAEIGPSYIWENVGDVSNNHLVLRVAERFTHNLSPTARIWQSVEYLPQEDQFSNYLLNAEIGVEAALNAHLNLRFVLQDKYNSQPPADLVSNDLTLIAGLSVKL